METFKANDNLISVLQRADRSLEQSALPDPSRLVLMVHLPKTSNLQWKTISLSAAALIMAALGLMYTSSVNRKHLAQINLKIQQLNTQADNTLHLVQDVIRIERHKENMMQLDNQLKTAAGAMDCLQAGIDKSAFALLHEADRLYKQLNMEASAVESYNLLIKLYPDNKWSAVAKERLDTINNGKSPVNNTLDKETKS